ncbi:MAG: type II CAAX prenyl endopeptidase Rce1 family protein [Candidatus Bathyarchaeia archaeon]
MTQAHSRSRTLITSILLFLIVFGLWQAYDLILLYVSMAPSLNYAFYFATYAIAFAVFVAFVKFGKSDFKKQGFKVPSNVPRTLLLSLFFVGYYIFVILVPGSIFGFSLRPLPSIFFIAFNIARAIVIGIITESVFRGYIFKNLVENHGFFTSLYLSSIMFGLHRYDDPVSIINLLDMSANQIMTDVVFIEVLPAFVAGLFLGYMFYKMDWSLLGPIIFRVGILIYFPLSPITVGMQWWMGLTFEIVAYAGLILIVDSIIKEPRYRRKKYGLES